MTQFINHAKNTNTLIDTFFILGPNMLQLAPIAEKLAELDQDVDKRLKLF